MQYRTELPSLFSSRVGACCRPKQSAPRILRCSAWLGQTPARWAPTSTSPCASSALPTTACPPTARRRSGARVNMGSYAQIQFRCRCDVSAHPSGPPSFQSPMPWALAFVCGPQNSFPHDIFKGIGALFWDRDVLPLYHQASAPPEDQCTLPFFPGPPGMARAGALKTPCKRVPGIGEVPLEVV